MVPTFPRPRPACRPRPRSFRAQRGTRDLHELRQPSRPLRPRRSRTLQDGRPAFRRHACRAGGPGRLARVRCHAPACASRSAPRSDGATPSLRRIPSASCSARRDRTCRRWRASFRTAAQCGVPRTRRPLSADRFHDRTTIGSSAPRRTRPRPGLLRVDERARARDRDGSLGPDRRSAFGSFVAGVPSPLAIGTVRLADGSAPKGFIVELAAVSGAEDISSYGGWRAFTRRRSA